MLPKLNQWFFSYISDQVVKTHLNDQENRMIDMLSRDVVFIVRWSMERIILFVLLAWNSSGTLFVLRRHSKIGTWCTIHQLAIHTEITGVVHNVWNFKCFFYIFILSRLVKWERICLEDYEEKFINHYWNTGLGPEVEYMRF